MLGAENPVRNRDIFTLLNFLLLSAGMASDTMRDYKKYLHSVWFKLLTIHDVEHSTSLFEHVFMGEVKNYTNITRPRQHG